MSKPWGGIGSWAAEAEAAAEADARETAVTTTTTSPQSFPSLKEAVTTKPKKKKMTLSEFNTYGGSCGGGSISLSGSTRFTPDEMLHLPTAPKPRSSDDFHGGGPRLGGGFSDYGGNRRRGGFDGERGGPGRVQEFDVQPSRADEVDNWASSKRAVPPPDSSRNSGSQFGSLGGGGSRADEVDNWNFGKKPAPPVVRSGAFGSGFRNSGSDWGTEREGGQMGRPRLVLDPPRSGGSEIDPPVVVVKTHKANPFGAARPRENVLAEKGLDWKKLDMEIEAKKGSSGGSEPASSQGSRPTSSQSNRSESVGLGGAGPEVVAVKPKPKVNPFGDAKPREVLLEEKGLDWRKIDLELEHRRVERPETEEEKALKEEIENLRNDLEMESGNGVSQGSGGQQTSLHDLIQIKEKDLEVLVRELDDKIRFGQKPVERPGSGAGMLTSDRPPSQSGSLNGARGPKTLDRPQSRGTGDVWARPGEGRRGGFQGGREKRFLSNKNFDRSRSRERW